MNENNPSNREAEGEVELDKTEARAGTTPGVARYVLGFSLVLVIVVFAIILLAR